MDTPPIQIFNATSIMRWLFCFHRRLSSYFPKPQFRRLSGSPVPVFFPAVSFQLLQHKYKQERQKILDFSCDYKIPPAKIKIHCFLCHSMLLYNKELYFTFCKKSVNSLFTGCKQTVYNTKTACLQSVNSLFPKYLFKIKIIFDQDENKFCT